MRTSEKGLRQGSDHPLSRKKRIGRVQARSDKALKVHERTLDYLVPGPPPPRRGRPALPAEAGKRYPLGIRTTKALRDALLSASHVSGRSLAQEIEFRLERSFLQANLVDEVCSVLERLRAEGRESLEQFLKELRQERAAADEEAYWHWSESDESESDESESDE
jgi:hypothetical protein